MGNVYPGHTGYTDIDMMEYKCYILHSRDCSDQTHPELLRTKHIKICKQDKSNFNCRISVNLVIKMIDVSVLYKKKTTTE